LYGTGFPCVHTRVEWAVICLRNLNHIDPAFGQGANQQVGVSERSLGRQDFISHRRGDTHTAKQLTQQIKRLNASQRNQRARIGDNDT
jgi:hypothetical protein